jgi:hypothetical protein
MEELLDLAQHQLMEVLLEVSMSPDLSGPMTKAGSLGRSIPGQH